MNLKEQQYVCTLARCQTISKAAEELYISPSALSVYISNLEKYLGISLFLRTGRSFVLTPIGEEYVSRARKMLEMKDEFDCLVDHARRKAHPSIRIGIQQRRAISIAPELLKRFMEEYPDVEIIFRDGNQEELAAMYREGTVDFVVTMYRDELADVTYRELAKEQVLVALPADHPANAYAYQEDGDDYLHLDMIHLDRETFILPTMAQSMRKTAERIFEQNHIRPRRILEVAHFDIIISMVELGLGIGFNRLGYIKKMSRFQNVRYYYIGRDSFYSRLILAYRKGRVLTECENRLIEILYETVRKQY